MPEQGRALRGLAAELIALYPRALPEVYGYVLARCGSTAVAEDLTGETFMAAVRAVQEASVESITMSWLIVVARRRLVDHWRRLERDQRRLRLLRNEAEETTDPWDELVDLAAVRSALERVGPHHRAALTLRYLDGLSVPEVARVLERGVHAMEALLGRARTALRRAYLEGASSAP